MRAFMQGVNADGLHFFSVVIIVIRLQTSLAMKA